MISNPVAEDTVQETTTYRQHRLRVQERIRIAARWLTTNLLLVAIWGVLAALVWAFFAAVGLNHGYQDTWILEGVWQPLLVALICYVITIYKDLDPGRTAMLTSIFVFTVYSASMLKYTYIYASTIDASIHFSMMRTLAESGITDNNVYAYTPGLHLLVASLAQLSGLPVTFWAKIVPALMGSLIPLGTYLLFNRLHMPPLLLRCVVIFSGMSLPMLYLPNGTSFAILIVSPLLSMVILQSIATPSMRPGFIALMALMGTALIIWHAISSLMIPLVFGVTGVFGLIFVWLWERVAYRQIWIWRAAFSLVIVGGIGFVCTLLYWRFMATPIWEQLMSNIHIFSQVVETQEASEGILIPERAFTLSTMDLIFSLLINHARDAAMLGFVALGGIFSTWELYRTWRTRKPEQRTQQMVRLFLILCVLFCFILVTTLATGFAKHGYKRYLLYVMAVSAPIAGYGLWKVVTLFNERRSRPAPNTIIAPLVGIVFLFSALQLFPYQPMVPRARIPGTDGTTPLFWQHQVNSDYQRHGIEFAFEQVDEDFNIFADYRTYQQAGIYLDVTAKRHFHYGTWPTPRPAYVLYHVPGAAGAYGEQAEFRTVEAIQALRDLPGVNTVYDNGGTFLMFVPERHLEKMYLIYTAP